ncbi:unnamed protein product, partial [Brenthis ino]
MENGSPATTTRKIRAQWISQQMKNIVKMVERVDMNSKQVYHYHIITNADIEEELTKSKQAYPIVHYKNETCYDKCGLRRRDSVQSIKTTTDDDDTGSERSRNIRLEDDTGRKE